MTDSAALKCFSLLMSMGMLGLVAGQAHAQGEDTTYRVVKGHPAKIEKHGWQVALSIKRGGVTYQCGASLITENWVLTAAHCLSGSAAAKGVTAKAGVEDYKKFGTWIEAERIIIHREYNRATQMHDIALIKLKSPPPGTSIPYGDPTTVPPIGKKLEVTGWGATREGGSGSPQLMVAEVPYVDNATCNAKGAYKGKISAGMMCAGYAEKDRADACQGDSGGPLVWRKEGDQPILVGIVSFGDGCARKLKFGVYTRVSSYHGWIVANLEAEGK
jgi:trypsin